VLGVWAFPECGLRDCPSHRCCDSIKTHRIAFGTRFVIKKHCPLHPPAVPVSVLPPPFFHLHVCLCRSALTVFTHHLFLHCLSNMFGKALVAVALAAVAFAQDPTIESPSSLVQCQPTLIKWNAANGELRPSTTERPRADCQSRSSSPSFPVTSRAPPRSLTLASNRAASSPGPSTSPPEPRSPTRLSTPRVTPTTTLPSLFSPELTRA